jgi:hypothetical protein
MADFRTDDFACKAHGNGVSAERVHSARCRRADILSAEPVPLKNGGGQHVPKPTADKMSALRSVQKSAAPPKPVQQRSLDFAGRHR